MPDQEIDAQEPAPGISGPYLLTRGGVYLKPREEGGKPMWLAGRFRVDATTYSEDERGLLLALSPFADDGIPGQITPGKRIYLPLAALAGDGAELRKLLLSHGVRVAINRVQRENLMAYVMRQNPTARVYVSRRSGWCPGWHFVVPGFSTSPETHLNLAPRNPSRWNSRGTLDDWKQDVAMPIRDEPALGLALCYGLASSLIGVVNGEPGGIHFHGPSTVGKTTASLVANSLWGPVERLVHWRTTPTALETVAQEMSGTILCLDEIDQATPWDAWDAAYMLAHGQGKLRGDKDGGLRTETSWRVLFISTGEISFESFIAQTGKVVRGGQVVRVLDIPFARPSLDPGHLRLRCLRSYGTAGPAFVQALTLPENRLWAKQAMAARLDVINREYQGQARRVAARLALPAVAGELAIRLGILPWAEDAPDGMAAWAFNWWWDAHKEDQEALQVVERVRHFLASNMDARFSNWENDQRSIHNMAGFLRRDNAMLFYIFKDIWKLEICKGMDHLASARELDKRGFLLRDGRNLTRRERLPLGVGFARVYVVRGAILQHLEEGDEEEIPK